VNILEGYVSGAYCPNCVKLVPLNGLKLKEGVCFGCGNNKLSPVAGKWNEEKQGWDYFSLTGKFIGTVLLENTTNKTEKMKVDLNHTKPKVYVQLSLFA